MRSRAADDFAVIRASIPGIPGVPAVPLAVADGAWLDAWGRHLNVARSCCESDSSYRTRLTQRLDAAYASP